MSLSNVSYAGRVQVTEVTAPVASAVIDARPKSLGTTRTEVTSAGMSILMLKVSSPSHPCPMPNLMMLFALAKPGPTQSRYGRQPLRVPKKLPLRAGLLRPIVSWAHTSVDLPDSAIRPRNNAVCCRAAICRTCVIL